MKIPLQKITDPLISNSGVDLFILRLDQIHPHISGNKFFKLKYNLEEARKLGKETLLTFGGAFSNHIAAVAAAGRQFNFKTIGIVRGEELQENNNETLAFAKKCGMELHFVSREEYRKKDTTEFLNSLTQQFNNFYLLPEGGTNELAVKGCAEILSLIDVPFDFVCCPVGTGGTLAGIISSLKEKQRAIGFSVLKDGEFLKKEVQKLIPSPCPLWEGDIFIQYHFGGYGKHTLQLLKFISDFEKQNNGSTKPVLNEVEGLTTSIPIEHVYTGKMMFGIYDLINKNYFQKGNTIIAIHTGGLQGKLPQP